MLDPGASALAFILQVLGLPANAAELVHQSGKATLDAGDLLRLARRFPVKARLIASNLERLGNTPLPALAQMRDGGWLVIGRIGDGKVLVQDPAAATPEALSAEVFADRWSGNLLLIARRATLTDPNSRFGVA